MKMQRIQNLMNEIQQWADTTFGIERKTVAPLHHLKKEVLELIEAIDNNAADIMIEREFADCFILLLNAASKHGYTVTKLTDAIEDKMNINKKRKWGNPDINGVCQHVEFVNQKEFGRQYLLNEFIEGDIFCFELEGAMKYKLWSVMPNGNIDVRWKPYKTDKIGWIETSACFFLDTIGIYLGHEKSEKQ